jgi:hypothetical protein
VLLSIGRLEMICNIFHQPALTPEKLEFLQGLLKRICAESDIDAKSPEAEGIASSLIWHFQSGVFDGDKLLTKLNTRNVT